ncbi:flagellar hook assembly protein FlgD [Mesobacillus harenae]|uniref:flagellar hook assembly protein FlgD n=1 Tax=Mesobacillus harenae TaxID=2213203 RepID=UPI001580E03C|nr:flagellar hook assembly protein FlgD [Mesobacillus harenae]
MSGKIDSSLLLSATQQVRQVNSSGSLGKDDFLKILMTQLQNQDPMNPMQDKDFVAQMATFSSLEQMTNMGKSMERFVQAEEQNKLISYSQFVGKEITYHKPSENSEQGTGVLQEGTGRVASIQFKNNNVEFLLEDGTALEPSNISKVNETDSGSQLLQASMLIGKTVTYTDVNKQEIKAAIQSVSLKDGKTLFQLNDEQSTSIRSSQFLKIE